MCPIMDIGYELCCFNYIFGCWDVKEEYEATLKRHVQFIQQLVDEKKKLSEKSEALASEMHQQASRHLHERRISDERHTNEIRRIKQVTPIRWIILGEREREREKRKSPTEDGCRKRPKRRGTEPNGRAFNHDTDKAIIFFSQHQSINPPINLSMNHWICRACARIRNTIRKNGWPTGRSTSARRRRAGWSPNYAGS